jgi:hypothetical protein
MSRYSYVSPGSNQPLVPVPSYAAQTMVAPVAAAPIAAAAAAPAAAGSSAMLESVIANLIAGIATQGAERMLFRPGGEALGPSSYATADPTGRSKYFTSTTEQLAVEQYLNNERFRRGLLSLIPGVRDALPPLPSREDIVGGFAGGEFTGGAALREAQAESLTRREIEKIRAEKEFEYAARLAEAQASIQRQKIQSLSEAQARVESQKVSSLGDVQRQRIQSQYGTAGDLLDAAIKNIAFRDKIESANTLNELARAV